MILYLVWDTSGSMSEGGKHMIARGVARSVEQYVRLGYGDADLKLFAWNCEVTPVEWGGDEDFPSQMLVCEGVANMSALIALLEEQPDASAVLITDGFWSLDESKTLKGWRNGLQQDALRVIKVGADANPRLKGEYVFAAEDVLLAMDGWLEGGAA
jgi:hypothetical protein